MEPELLSIVVNTIADVDESKAAQAGSLGFVPLSMKLKSGSGADEVSRGNEMTVGSSVFSSTNASTISGIPSNDRSATKG